MSNHVYVISKPRLTVDRVQDDLAEVLERRFKGFVTSVKNSDSEGWWQVGCRQSKNIVYPVSFFLETRNRLNFRPSVFYWGGWVEAVVENELAAKYQGHIVVEGFESDKIKPQPERYPTYMSWVEDRIKSSLGPGEKIKPKDFEDRVNRYPKTLKPLLK